MELNRDVTCDERLPALSALVRFEPRVYPEMGPERSLLVERLPAGVADKWPLSWTQDAFSFHQIQTKSFIKQF